MGFVRAPPPSRASGMGVGSSLLHSLLLVGTLSSSCASSAALGSSSCIDLGFTGLNVCSDCETLSSVVGDEELVAECRRCCAVESEDENKGVVFTNVHFEVCK
ncbi:hypothetical protein PPROV_000019800 [Pycnococcus provasolii]|uniref:Selenoprotein F/M domain-containing protein n=1 Tax=Pycnococcus provasolii TaxID=41880 RepID=A0A830H4I1_9CHLO|nr:hypothetical protein PPROV_000019800 [Pycnococcus provasolii]